MRRKSSENEGSGIRIVNGYIDLASLLHRLPSDLRAEVSDEYIVLSKHRMQIGSRGDLK